MSDGIYQGCNPFYHDIPILVIEDVLYNIYHMDIDSLDYLQMIHQAGLIRK